MADHGPHVEKRNDPDAASVRLDVYIPHLKRTASIIRTIRKPKNPKVAPNDAAVKAVFAQLVEHTEVTLSRREIIKFILSEATKRSRDVQTLLKLDDIDQTRATLKTTENKLTAEQATAKALVDASEDSLKRHLDLAALNSDDVLAALNRRRQILGLAALEQLTRDTDVCEGIAHGNNDGEAAPSKETALTDLEAVH